jgi:hypothetical protein
MLDALRFLQEQVRAGIINGRGAESVRALIQALEDREQNLARLRAASRRVLALDESGDLENHWASSNETLEETKAAFDELRCASRTRLTEPCDRCGHPYASHDDFGSFNPPAGWVGYASREFLERAGSVPRCRHVTRGNGYSPCTCERFVPRGTHDSVRQEAAEQGETLQS